MDEARWGEKLEGLSDRLARLEERGSHRDVQLASLHAMLIALTEKVDELADGMRDAKTGMRIVLWIGGTGVPTMAAMLAYLTQHWWPGAR